jgi:hypothetical protein
MRRGDVRPYAPQISLVHSALSLAIAYVGIRRASAVLQTARTRKDGGADSLGAKTGDVAAHLDRGRPT